MTTVERKQKNLKFAKIMFLVVFLLAFFLFFNSLLNWQFLLLIAGFPILFWIFRNRLWILLVLALPGLLLGEVVNLSISNDWVYEARISEVLLILAFLIFSIDAFLNQKIKDIKVDKIMVVLLAYLMLSILSFYQIIDFRFFVAGLKIMGFSFMAYFLALNFLNSQTSIKWFFRSLIFTVFALSIQVFIKFYQMGFSSKFFFERSFIEVPLGPIALVSAALAFLLPLILSFYFKENEDYKERAVSLVVFFLGSVAVFLSLGKAAIFSFALALFYLFIKLKEKRIIFVLTGLAFTSLAFIFFTSFFTGLLERVEQTFVSENTQFRVTEYQVGWGIIQDNFILGVGSGQQLYYYQDALNWDDPQLVNNYFLQSFIELGIVGLAVMVTALVIVYRRAREQIESGKGSGREVLVYGFVAGFIAVLLNGLAEVTIFAIPYAIIFWLVLGVFINLKKYA